MQSIRVSRSPGHTTRDFSRSEVQMHAHSTNLVRVQPSAEQRKERPRRKPRVRPDQCAAEMRRAPVFKIPPARAAVRYGAPGQDRGLQWSHRRTGSLISNLTTHVDLPRASGVASLSMSSLAHKSLPNRQSIPTGLRCEAYFGDTTT